MNYFVLAYVGNLPFVKVSLDKDMSIACAHPSKWTTGPIITLWVLVCEYFNINKYNLFTVDKIIHRVLPWLRMLAVKLQLIEIEGYLVRGEHIFFIVVYIWLTFSVQSKSFFSVRFSSQHFHVESSVLSSHVCVWLEQRLTCWLFKDHGNFGLLQKNHVKQKKMTFI